MSAITHALVSSVAAARRRRARAQGDQSGYLLIYVLGVIGLTSVLVIALLGLALTSAKVAAMEARLARESRAADGALEAQVADIASRGGDVCGNSSTWPRTVEASGTGPEVEVTCDFGGVSDDPDADLPGPDVQVVGAGGAADSYQGGLLPAPSISGVADPTVVVKASGHPAQFASDLFVAGGAAPNRTGGSPAVDVAGQYEQGAAVGGSGCGALAAAGAHRIDDAGGQGEPTCGSVRPITAVAPVAVDAVPYVTGRAMTCPNVQLDPGAYLPADITRLNAILSGNEDCTVVFKPGGVHYLDVFDATRSGADRFVLTISNKNAKVIGGIPTSPLTFPNACVNAPGSGGVQLVLSGRSAISRTGGQVALCPDRTTGSALPVLQQSSSSDSQPRFVSATSSSFTHPENLDPANSGWATTNVCGGTGPDDWYVWGDIWTGLVLYPRCWERSFASTWSSTGVGPLASAQVQLDMQQSPQNFKWLGFDDPGSFHNVDLGVRFTVSGPWGSCTTEDMKAGRSYSATLSYELRNNVAGNTCYGTLTDQAQLDGATVTATFFRFNVPGNGLVGIRLDVRNLRIETNSVAVAPTGAGAADAVWQTPANALAADNAVASVTQDAIGFTWLPGGGVWVTPGTTTSMVLTGLDVPAELRSSDHLSRLGVTLRGPANQVSYLADPVDNGLTRVELVNSAGQVVCSTAEDTVTKAYTQSNQYLRYDLIAPGNCAGLRTVGQLDGLDLKLTFRVGCAILSLTNSPVYGPDGRCASVPLPKVDALSLSVGTDTVTGRPPYSSVTTNVADSTSFDAFGPVALPLSDLDVRYTGTTSWPGGFSRPTFEGPLQVHGLGVEQAGTEPGVVCCVVGRDAAVLVARVDGQVRAQAAVRVNPATTGSPTARRPVDVLSWKLCSRVGC